MWLKDHYYKVLTRCVSDGYTVFRIVLLPDCEVYRGHFPGHPVCPGAFNIQMVKECAMEVSGKALHIHTIKLCRLTAVVSPCTCTELDVAVRLSPVEDGLEVRARVADGEQVYMEYKGLMTVV